MAPTYKKTAFHEIILKAHYHEIIPDAVKPIHLCVGGKAPLVLNILVSYRRCRLKIADELLDLA